METQFLADHQEKLDAMGSELQQMEGSFKDLGKRIDILEQQHKSTLGRAESAEAAARRIEKEDELSVQESIVLVEGSYEEKEHLRRTKELAEMSPGEAKAGYKQDQADDAWAEDMLKLGGQKG